MILVTGAAGKTGLAVISALAGMEETVRALVHRSDQTQSVKEAGALESFIGNMTHKTTFDEAVQGIESVYHICPNVSPHEVEIGRAAIQACLDHEVVRFVYHSVLHPQTRDMPHHWAKLQVEELLFQSGLEYTILQPAAYMQNIRGSWNRILEERIFSVPYPVETRISIVDLRDVAKVAAKVVVEPVHIGATYELAGPENLSQEEVAQVLSEELGDEVCAEEESLDSWQARAQTTGMGTYEIETLLKMFKYYSRNNFLGNPIVLEHLLGRPPTTLREFLRWII